MSKKLTLNETWVLCLKMWKWIAGQVKTGSKKDAELLKREWMENNRDEDEGISSDCFFCDYAYSRLPQAGGYPGHCKACPARKIDKKFSCMYTDYDYEDNPIPFYNKLVSLNRKRLKKKT